MVLNKKGIVFTLVTITILSIFAVSYGSYSLLKDRSSVSKRIGTLNNFVVSVEQDLSRQIFVSGYRAVFILNKEILDTGDYIEDVNHSVNELYFNGTLNGTTKDLMTDVTFAKLQGFLSDSADKINAEVSLLDPSMTLTQDNPWSLKITLNTTLIIVDKGGLASWNRTAAIQANIPTTNLGDPLYSKNVQFTNKVNQTPYAVFVTGIDYSNLTSHFENSYYKASTSAPSYLQRLEGNLAADPNGVESLVYPQALADKGIDVKSKSLIDYIYFSNSDPQAYTVPVTDLILDNETNHLALYNLTGLGTPLS